MEMVEGMSVVGVLGGAAHGLSMVGMGEIVCSSFSPTTSNNTWKKNTGRPIAFFLSLGRARKGEGAASSGMGVE